MREACLILKNHLNDDIKALKSKEVVRPCMLLPFYHHNNKNPTHPSDVSSYSNDFKLMSPPGLLFTGEGSFLAPPSV